MGDANVTGEMRDVFCDVVKGDEIELEDFLCDNDKGDEIEVDDFVEYDDVTLWRNIASSSSEKINKYFLIMVK